MPTSHSTANANAHWLIRAKKRLLSEFKKISDNPSDNIRINFKEDQFLEWHFLFKGLKETPFKGGEYHGMLKFPENYPFSPPSIQFFTPNGRFKTNERVCFILSDFHPDCWKPGYTVSAVLQGAYSFMMDETTETVGSMIMDRNEIINLARMSKEFNRGNDTFNELFNEKADEDVNIPLNNLDDTDRISNIERPSNLIPIPMTETTRLAQSESTNKTNERPLHLAKVPFLDKEEQAIGQTSLFPANISRNITNNPSTNSVKDKGSHTSKLLERTLPERSNPIHSRNTTTGVSQQPERPENISLRSSDYVVNNNPHDDHYKRDTSDNFKPNKEVSFERTNDLSIAQMPQTGHTPSSLLHDQNGITSVASDSSKELSFRKSQPNLTRSINEFSADHLKEPSNSSTAHQSSSMMHIGSSYSPTSKDRLIQNATKDNRPTHLLESCETDSILEADHTLNSLTHNQDEIPSVVHDSLKEFSSKKSDLHSVTDTWITNHSKESEKEFNRDNNTINQLFKEKAVETIKHPLDKFQTGHKKHQSTLIAPDSRIKHSEIIERSSEEFNKDAHASTDSILIRPNNEKNKDSLNLNHVQDKSVSVQPYSFYKAEEQPPQHSKVSPLEKAKQVQATSEIGVQTISEKERNQKTITDERMVHQPHPPGKTKDDSMRKSYRSTKYLVDDQSRIISMTSDSTNKFSSQIPGRNQNNTADKLLTHPPGEFENDLRPKFDRAHKSFVGSSEGGITTDPTDNLKQSHPQISRPNLGNILNKEGIYLPKKSENSSTLCEFDHTPNSLADKNIHSDCARQESSYLPSTILVNYENPDTMQTFTTPSNNIPKNINSKLQDSAVSNPIKNKSPENTSVNKTSEFNSKSSLNLSDRNTYNRPLSHPHNSSTRGKSLASKESSSEMSRHQINTLDKQVANPSGRSENGSVSNSDRIPNYLAGNKVRIPTVPSDYLEKFSSQMSRPHHSKTIDTWVTHPPKESENSPVCNLDQVRHSLYDKKNDSTSDWSKQLECIPNVDVDSVPGLNSGQFLPLTPISNTQPGKDYNLGRERDPIRSNPIHSDNPRRVFYSKPIKVPEAHYEDHFILKTSQTSSGNHKDTVSINTEFLNFQSLPSYPPHSIIKGVSLENLSSKTTNDRLPSLLPNSSTRNRSPVSSSAKKMNERPPSNPHYSSTRNIPSQNTRDDKSITRSPSLTSINRSQGHGITNTLNVPPEKNRGNPRSDQAPLSFNGNRSRIILDESIESCSQTSRHNQVNTLDKQVTNPSGRSENGSVSNCNRIPNYLAGNKGRIPTVPSIDSEKFSSKNDSTSDLSKQLECIPNADVDSVPGLNSDLFFSLTPILNTQPGKDCNLSREIDPIRSNIFHSDKSQTVFHSAPSELFPEVQYEDPFTIKTNITSPGNIPRETVSLNTELHNFDKPDSSFYNKSTPNLRIRRFIEIPPSNPPNSSAKNKSPINTSAKRTNEIFLYHLPNSLTKRKILQNTNGSKAIYKPPSHSSITSSSIPQDHGKTKTHILNPDGSILILTSNNYRDSKCTGPIKSDHGPSSANIRSHDDKFKQFSTPTSRIKSADKSIQGSRHTLPIQKSHYSSFSSNNHDHDVLNQPAKGNNHSFSRSKVEYPKSFNSNLPQKEKFSIDMKPSKYTDSNSLRYETHQRLIQAKNYSNSLLSRNEQRIKNFSLNGFGSEC